MLCCIFQYFNASYTINIFFVIKFIGKFSIIQREFFKQLKISSYGQLISRMHIVSIMSKISFISINFTRKSLIIIMEFIFKFKV